MKNNEERILNYLSDKILSNRWKEYDKIQKMIMHNEITISDYVDVSDKLRELELKIEETLSARSQALARRQMYGGIIDREKKTIERTE